VFISLSPIDQKISSANANLSIETTRFSRLFHSSHNGNVQWIVTVPDALLSVDFLWENTHFVLCFTSFISFWICELSLACCLVPYRPSLFYLQTFLHTQLPIKFVAYVFRSVRAMMKNENAREREGGI